MEELLEGRQGPCRWTCPRACIQWARAHWEPIDYWGHALLVRPEIGSWGLPVVLGGSHHLRATVEIRTSLNCSRRMKTNMNINKLQICTLPHTALPKGLRDSDTQAICDHDTAVPKVLLSLASELPAPVRRKSHRVRSSVAVPARATTAGHRGRYQSCTGYFRRHVSSREQG